MPQSTTTIVLLGIIVTVFTCAVFIDPIAQDPGYHRFVDTRSLLNIPNFYNVVSNVPFLLIGIAGIALLKNNRAPGVLPEIKWIYTSFFIGVSFIGLGSAYYHLNPTNSTLVWDRMPITIAFMAFFSIIVAENISVAAGKKLALPLMIIGILSVQYWFFTESIGKGDLRPYALVQYLPMLLIPLILVRYRSKLSGNKFIWWMLLAYVLSKFAERYDQNIFSILNVLSGHSIKHLLAAIAVWFFYLAIKCRTLQS